MPGALLLPTWICFAQCNTRLEEVLNVLTAVSGHSRRSIFQISSQNWSRWRHTHSSSHWSAEGQIHTQFAAWGIVEIRNHSTDCVEHYNYRDIFKKCFLWGRALKVCATCTNALSRLCTTCLTGQETTVYSRIRVAVVEFKVTLVSELHNIP